jgi:signal transduction histidine kinase
MAHKFGLIGGILSSIVLSLIYNPKAYLIVFSGDKELIRPVLEILMMYTLAIFSGLFSQKIYCEKEKLKKVSEELKDSLVLLERSVEEKIKMEKEIAKADRLRVIGQLTAGIAHEIRNPLAAIRSGIKLLKNRKSNERIVDLVISEVDRLNSFVERFLQYASVGKSEDIEIRAKELFDEVRELTKLTCKNKKDIIFQSTLEIDGDVLIRGDKNYLKQALFNIVLNSIEACESMNYQGKVLVNGYFDEKAVFFKVSDNGPGISESVRDTIFEPFFTTKEKGTGLGLTIANKIIKEHDGEISIENNGGLRFIVKLLRYK